YSGLAQPHLVHASRGSTPVGASPPVGAPVGAHSPQYTSAPSTSSGPPHLGQDARVGAPAAGSATGMGGSRSQRLLSGFHCHHVPSGARTVGQRGQTAAGSGACRTITSHIGIVAAGSASALFTRRRTCSIPFARCSHAGYDSVALVRSANASPSASASRTRANSPA